MTTIRMMEKSVEQPITVFGLGMGEVNLSAAQRQLLTQASVFAGGKRQLAALDAVAEAAGRERIVLADSLESFFLQLGERHAKGARIVVLADGDPLYFGIGTALVQFFGAEQVRIFPAVCSMQAAAAKLGLSWPEVRSISLHGRVGEAAQEAWLALAHAVLEGSPVCVLTDAKNRAPLVAAWLLERGVAHYEIAILENIGLSNESCCIMPLSAAAKYAPAALHLVFLVPKIHASKLHAGLADSFFSREKELITKAPIRALGLSALQLRHTDTVWDLGAGCGGMTMEIAGYVRKGHVVAVEQDANRVAHILENRRRCVAVHVDVIRGNWQILLATLPNPDAAFIGGGLGGANNTVQLTRVLQAVWGRLPVGGRLVAHCILLGSMDILRTALADVCKAPPVISLAQVSQTAALAGDIHFVAHNPVYIVQFVKESV